MTARRGQRLVPLIGVTVVGVLGMSGLVLGLGYAYPGGTAVASSPQAPPTVAPAVPSLAPVAVVPSVATPSASSVPSQAPTPAVPSTPAAAAVPTLPAAPAVPGTQGQPAVPILAPLPIPGYAKEPPTASYVAPFGGTLDVSPDPGAKPVGQLTSPTWKGAPLRLLVLAHGTGTAAGWIRVALEQRPNGTYGWVKASQVTETADPYRIVVLQSRHRVLVWKGDSLIGNEPVAVGKASTPTPNGTTYVDLLVDTGNPYGDYGRWILGLAAHSDVYQTFGADNGDALIGLHGTDEPGSIGYSVSHGCVRAPNAFVSELASVIPLGTRVDIVA